MIKIYYKIINKNGDVIGKIRIKSPIQEDIDSIKKAHGEKTWHKITWWKYRRLKLA